MKKIAVNVLTFVLTAGMAATVVAAQEIPVAEKITTGPSSVELVVDCERGDKITRALNIGKRFREVHIYLLGTCVESPIVISRDDVAISGIGENPELVGLIDVISSSRVTFKDFTIRDGDDVPRDASRGAINAVNGSAVVIDNMRVENILNARSIRVEGSSAIIRDTTVLGSAGGSYVFRTSNIRLAGEVEGSDGLFGMSLTASKAFAREATLTFNNNAGFGLVIQADSSMEHVVGQVNVIGTGGFGFVLAGQGSYAFGSEVDIRETGGFAFFVDELSNFTPLIGAPLPPSMNVSDNPGVGMQITRGSAVQFIDPTTVTDNGVGLDVDDSILVADGLTVEDNDADVRLVFGTRASFGAGNVFGTPIACDDTVLVRGADACGAIAASTARITKTRLKVSPADLEFLAGIAPGRVLQYLTD